MWPVQFYAHFHYVVFVKALLMQSTGFIVCLLITNWIKQCCKLLQSLTFYFHKILLGILSSSSAISYCVNVETTFVNKYMKAEN